MLRDANKALGDRMKEENPQESMITKIKHKHDDSRGIIPEFNYGILPNNDRL